MTDKKWIYYFSGKECEGSAKMTPVLGGKGANLAEMANLGLPVPPGFTITTDVCNEYYKDNKCQLPPELRDQVLSYLKKVEEEMGRKFGDPEMPLLVSVRSGAAVSMPGMMDTVLNVGLNEKTREGLIKYSNNPRFVYDAHRRLIQMYADIVMEKAAGIEPKDEFSSIAKILDGIKETLKKEKGKEKDSDLDAEDLKELIVKYKEKVNEVFGKPFPDDPLDQLFGAIAAVFQSWMGKKAISYRAIEKLPDTMGTAVTVQTMVFGNMGPTSGTGVAFTRDPATGENYFYGEWLPNAQGEDVVAGKETPHPLNDGTKTQRNKHLASLEAFAPETYQQLFEIKEKLEKHYKDMLDIEFTIQDKKLFMLQCRVGKRTGPAAVKMAMDMLKEGLIDEKTAVLRVKPSQVVELLLPVLDAKVEKGNKPLAIGLPAGPGCAVGQIVFTSTDAVKAMKASNYFSFQK